MLKKFYGVTANFWDISEKITGSFKKIFGKCLNILLRNVFPRVSRFSFVLKQYCQFSRLLKFDVCTKCSRFFWPKGLLHFYESSVPTPPYERSNSKAREYRDPVARKRCEFFRMFIVNSVFFCHFWRFARSFNHL